MWHINEDHSKLCHKKYWVVTDLNTDKVLFVCCLGAFWLLFGCCLVTVWALFMCCLCAACELFVCCLGTVTMSLPKFLPSWSFVDRTNTGGNIAFGFASLTEPLNKS